MQCVGDAAVSVPRRGLDREADLVDRLRGQAHRCTDCGLNSTTSGGWGACEDAMAKRVRVCHAGRLESLSPFCASCALQGSCIQLLVLVVDARELWGPGV